MKTDTIRIKRKTPYFLYGALSLLLIIGGTLLIAFPFLSSRIANPVPCYIGGAVLAACGIAWYALVIVKELRSPDALVLTNKGFTNHLIGGRNGVYVDWTNVASIKIFGLSKAPSLGLTLENNEIYLQSLEGRDLETARDNLSMDLPLISIPQRSVKLPIMELKTLFSKMVKGAISWESCNTQSKKGEPKRQEIPTFSIPVRSPAEQIRPSAEDGELPIKKEVSIPVSDSPVIPEIIPGFAARIVPESAGPESGEAPSGSAPEKAPEPEAPLPPEEPFASGGPSPAGKTAVFDSPAPAVEPEAYDEPAPAVEPEAYVEPAPVVEPEAFDEPAPVVEPEAFDEPAPVVEPEAADEPIGEFLLLRMTDEPEDDRTDSIEFAPLCFTDEPEPKPEPQLEPESEEGDDELILLDLGDE